MSTSAPTADTEAGRGRYVLVFLCVLLAFASISTNLYLPALPNMAAGLHASGSVLEYTISGFLLGFSLGQLVWGPVSDRCGRRAPIAVGLAMFVVGSSGCALATSVEMVIGFRILQGAGACASVVLARAMVGDMYSGTRAAQMMSTLMSAVSIAPLLAPTLGGAILHAGSWRAIFWALSGVGIATFLGLRLLPETLPKSKRNNRPLINSFSIYGPLLLNKRLLKYAGVCGFYYGGIYAFIAGTPFAYITYYGVSPQAYGIIFGGSIIGVIFTNYLNARLVSYLGSDNLMRIGAKIAAGSGIVLCITSMTDFGGVIGLMVPIFLFISMGGFIAANAIAGSLNVFRTNAGAVSALVGSVQFGFGIVGSASLGIFADSTPRPMGCVIAAMAIASAACAISLVRPADGSAGKE